MLCRYWNDPEVLSKLGKAMGGDFPLAGPGAVGVAAGAEGEEEEEGEEADEDEPPLLTAASGGDLDVCPAIPVWQLAIMALWRIELPKRPF